MTDTLCNAAPHHAAIIRAMLNAQESIVEALLVELDTPPTAAERQFAVGYVFGVHVALKSLLPQDAHDDLWHSTSRLLDLIPPAFTP